MKHKVGIWGVSRGAVLIVGVVGWFLAGVRGVGKELAVVSWGKEEKVKRWMRMAEVTEDNWYKWKYCRKILAVDRENPWALTERERIYSAFQMEAFRSIKRGEVDRYIRSLVRALMIKSDESPLWAELDKAIKLRSGKHFSLW